MIDSQTVQIRSVSVRLHQVKCVVRIRMDRDGFMRASLVVVYPYRICRVCNRIERLSSKLFNKITRGSDLVETLVIAYY